jgi:hypothetical protein
LSPGDLTVDDASLDGVPPAGGVFTTPDDVPAADDVLAGDEECVADALAEAELAGLVVPPDEAFVVGFAVVLFVAHGV